MRIIKTFNDIIKEKVARTRANKGCSICPCCGNSKLNKPFESTLYYKDGINMRIYRVEGSWKTGKVDYYTCQNCGAEWESKIY